MFHSFVFFSKFKLFFPWDFKSGYETKKENSSPVDMANLM